MVSGVGATEGIAGGLGFFGMSIPFLFWGGLSGLLAWVAVKLLAQRQRRERVAVRAVPPERRLYDRYRRGR